MQNIGKSLAGMISGAFMATLLAILAFGLLRLGFHFFPWMPEVGRVPWIAWVTVFALPEAAFIVAMVVLWRKRRPVAIGILFAAILLGTHFAMHIATHWRDS